MRFISRLLFWVIALPLGAAIIVFALSNRQTLPLAFWPFDEGLELPVYAIALGPLLAGLLAGLFTGAGRRLATLARTRALAHRVAVLERQLEAATTAAKAAPSALEDHP